MATGTVDVTGTARGGGTLAGRPPLGRMVKDRSTRKQHTLKMGAGVFTDNSPTTSLMVLLACLSG